MKRLYSILLALLVTGSTFGQSDLGFDPTAPQGSDFIGFKHKIKTHEGQQVMWFSMSLLCLDGQAKLDTAGLVFDSNLVYYHTPAILEMELRTLGGTVVSTQTIDYWHVSNHGGQINYADPLRVADTIGFNRPNQPAFTDPNTPLLDGTDYAPEMTEGYQNGFYGANEQIPVYLVLGPGFASGVYEFCVDADFSYFVNESNDPDEFPDSWCYAVNIDVGTGLIDKVAYPAPPVAPSDVQSVDVAYNFRSSTEAVVSWPNVPEASSFAVETWIRHGNFDRPMNTDYVTTNGYSIAKSKIEYIIQQLGYDKNDVKFYFKVKARNAAGESGLTTSRRVKL